MKKLILLAASAILVACGGASQSSFTIKGTIEGLDSMVSLQYFNGSEIVKLDSTEVTPQGTFEFSGTVEMPIYASVVGADNSRIASLFIENTDLTLTGKMSDLGTVVIAGGTLNPIYDSIGASLEGVQTLEEYVSRIEKGVLANNNNIAGLYAFTSQLAPYLELEKLIEIADKFDTMLNNSIYMKNMRAKIDMLKKTAVGEKFVDFTSKDVEGNVVKLSDIAGKGKWVLLDFWAAWCPPCRAENPHLVELYNMYNKKGFTIVGYSLDKSKEDWVEAIKKDKLNWTNLSDLEYWDSKPSQTYGVSSIPSNVMISPDGVIVAKNLRGEDLTNFLKENVK